MRQKINNAGIVIMNGIIFSLKATNARAQIK